MNIALVGYGKMGKTIETIAVERGHTIVSIITSKTNKKELAAMLQKADVVIEFTNPESTVENILKCFTAGVPVVCGSTRWLKDWSKIEKACKDQNGSLLYASNFSIGVNIFFELNKKLASLMAGQPSYDIEITEIHHTKKKDAPSGTAIRLAEQIIEEIPQKNKWIKEKSNDRSDLIIHSERIDPAPGTHYVKYSSDIDDIEIIHTAHNRKGFALGAVLAAEFLKNKKGIYSMKDVLSMPC